MDMNVQLHAPATLLGGDRVGGSVNPSTGVASPAPVGNRTAIPEM